MPGSSGKDEARSSGLPDLIYELFLVLERGGNEGVLVAELPVHLRGADLLIVANRERPNPEWESDRDASRRGVHYGGPKTLSLTEFGQVHPVKGFQRFGLSPLHIHVRLQDDAALRLRLTNAGRAELAEWRMRQDGNRSGGAEPLPTRDSASAEPSAVHADSMLSPAKLAKTFGVPVEALRKRLERFRKKNHTGWIENTDRSARDPQYLYHVGTVRPIIEDLRASSDMSSSRPPQEI